MKYVIDVPNNMIIKSALNGLTLGIPMLVSSTQKEFVIPTNLQLDPYTEPDHKAIEDEVWEFMRICLTIDGSDFVDAFDSCSYINLLEYSYQEAKAKYEAWLKQKEDEIHVGDEVENASHKKGIVFNHCISHSNGLKYVRVLYIDDDGNSFISAWEKNNVGKTGRHFDEAEVLLKNMSGEQ